MYRNYTDEDIKLAVVTSTSVGECLRKLGLKPRGGNYNTMKRNIARLELDVSHFTGKGWKLGKFTPLGNLRGRESIRRFLLRKRGHRCESCGLGFWLHKKIPLEVDHTDGNNQNNTETNLKLLCCNCHAQTPTWRNRKRK